ncbi:Uma2 family endonuclease [Camelliibacillus cellulosilyticus]|uniref:Uma2 family endonuclease n=1 Tax=Camelliibacillus cellulosilyticus TaxID=2174486 RepID=A0ABV9GKC8_9BACL
MSNDEKKKHDVIKEQEIGYDEFERFEIIGGVRYELKPAPTVNHQLLLGHLYHMFYSSCQLNGVVLISPLDVYFDEDNLFQPDLVFISNENLTIIKEKRIEGAPDLVAEILSPSTSINDKIRKKKQYERFGVKEYWIIDPVHLLVDQLIRNDGSYELYATYGNDMVIHSPFFSCIAVHTDKLFKNLF